MALQTDPLFRLRTDPSDHLVDAVDANTELLDRGERHICIGGGWLAVEIVEAKISNSHTTFSTMDPYGEWPNQPGPLLLS
jgi:hypothetical protein